MVTRTSKGHIVTHSPQRSPVCGRSRKRNPHFRHSVWTTPVATRRMHPQRNASKYRIRSHMPLLSHVGEIGSRTLRIARGPGRMDPRVGNASTVMDSSVIGVSKWVLRTASIGYCSTQAVFVPTATQVAFRLDQNERRTHARGLPLLIAYIYQRLTGTFVRDCRWCDISCGVGSNLRSLSKAG